MRLFRTGFARFILFTGLPGLLGALLTGCGATNGPGHAADALVGPPPDVETLYIGDYIKVDFAGPEDLKPVETKINDQGTITLQHIGAIRADGLKPRELEAAIVTNYVPAWYKTLAVTVTPQGRMVTVGGDVRTPSALLYTSGMTVTRAIQMAGGFNEFADKTNVRLRRAKAKKDIIVNVKKAILNPEYDYPVYPGDSIMVRRRFY
jgi:protein involved in polysaccharide export with SLBB domain